MVLINDNAYRHKAKGGQKNYRKNATIKTAAPLAEKSRASEGIEFQLIHHTPIRQLKVFPAPRKQVLTRFTRYFVSVCFRVLKLFFSPACKQIEDHFSCKIIRQLLLPFSPRQVDFVSVYILQLDECMHEKRKM